jgi:uncharacterized membrane protein YeaQ/YmgE (transglycosylase-associated protein family)
MFILWWTIVGLLAGWVTGRMMKSSALGWVRDISIGIAGAMIGGFVMRGARVFGSGRVVLCDPRRHHWRGAADFSCPSVLSQKEHRGPRSGGTLSICRLSSRSSQQALERINCLLRLRKFSPGLIQGRFR